MESLIKKIEHKKTIFLLISVCLFYLLLKMIILARGKVYFDEGVYLGIAKYFASAGQAGYFESLRPLALPALLTPFQWLPLDSLVTGRIISLALVVLSILLVYHLAKKHYGKQAGLWSAFLFAGSCSVVLLSGYILTDLPAYLLALWAASLILEKRYFWGGMALGAGFLFKFPAIIILPILVLAAIYKERKRFFFPLGRFAGGLSLAVFPYFLFNMCYHEGSAWSRLFSPLFQASGHIGKVWADGATLLDYLALLARTETALLLAAALGSYCCFASADCRFTGCFKKNREAALIFLACAAVFLAYFSLQVPRLDERYLLSALPFLAVLGGQGIDQLAGKKLLQKKKISRCLPIPIPALIIVLILLLPGLAALNRSLAEKPIQTDQEIKEMISADQEKILLTNSGFVLLHTSAKAEMAVIPYFTRAYLEYRLNENISRLYFSPDEYPDFRQQLNYVLEKNRIRGCGYLHGSKIVVLDKEEGMITRKECLEKINQDYTPLPEPERFAVLSMTADEEGKFKNLRQAEELISMMLEKGIQVYLEIEENSFDGELLPLLKKEGMQAAFNPEQGLPSSTFREMIFRLTGKEIVCVADYWQQSSCRKTNIYLIHHPQEKQIRTQAELLETYAAVTQSDYLLGISIPADILTEDNLAVLRDFLNSLPEEKTVVIG